jgi:hypothetical protein
VEEQQHHRAEVPSVLPPEFAARQKAAVPGDYLAVAIDHDRNIETERLDAVCDLPNLFLAVDPRVRPAGSAGS